MAVDDGYLSPGVRQLRTFGRSCEIHGVIRGPALARPRSSPVRPSLEIRIATTALQAKLDASSPRGSEVRAAASDLARLARRDGYSADALTDLLRDSLLPLLRRRHEGPAGDWLWDRVVAWCWGAFAPAEQDEASETFDVPAPAAADAGDVDGTQRAVVGRVAGVLRALPDRVPDSAPSVYRVDQHDVITRVNTAWRTFAAANGAPTLASSAVGTSLWAHVSGTETRRLYGALYATVRATGRAVTLPYRCDAPDERRWMELTVRPLGGGQLQVVSALVRRVQRAPVLLLDATVPRGDWPMLVCGWCNRVRTVSHAALDSAVPAPWVNVESVRAGLTGATVLPRLMHDACPDCADEVRTLLASA